MTRANRRYAMKRARVAKRSGVWGEWIEHPRHEWPKRNPLAGTRRVFQNDMYIVLWREIQTLWGDVINLMVRPHSERAGRSWADLQRIKNDLVGRNATAVEVYPSKANLVDHADMYHLWVLPGEDPLPFGLHLDTHTDGAGLAFQLRDLRRLDL